MIIFCQKFSVYNIQCWNKDISFLNTNLWKRNFNFSSFSPRQTKFGGKSNYFTVFRSKSLLNCIVADKLHASIRLGVKISLAVVDQHCPSLSPFATCGDMIFKCDDSQVSRNESLMKNTLHFPKISTKVATKRIWLDTTVVRQKRSKTFHLLNWNFLHSRLWINFTLIDQWICVNWLKLADKNQSLLALTFIIFLY